MRKSVIIFICTFDPFDKGLYKYTFSNVCHEDKEIMLEDGALKIFFNVHGNMDNASNAQKNFLNYVNGGKAKDSFTKEVDSAVESYRGDGEKEDTYMSLEQMLMDREDDGRKAGKAEGRAEGKAEGLLEGTLRTLASMIKKGLISAEEAAKEASMTVPEFKKAIATL